jgi:zinc transporter
MTPAETATRMRAPASGIIWAFRFRPGEQARPIAEDRVDQALAEPDGWTWVHLALADARCRNWITQHAPLSQLSREVLLGADEHMRLDEFGDEVIGIIPDLQHELSREADDMVRLRFVMTERMIISVRRKPVHSAELTHRLVEGGKIFATPVALIDTIIDQFASAIARLSERLGDELDLIEDQVLHEDFREEGQRLGRTRMQAVRIHRQLSQLRSLFHRLESRFEASDDAADERTALAIRAIVQKLDSLDSDYASLYERARLLQDEVVAKMTAITNRRLFTLSILTACLLPPTLVTGFFGMNTKDLPFLDTSGGTWFAMLIALAAAAAAYWAIARLRAL